MTGRSQLLGISRRNISCSYQQRTIRQNHCTHAEPFHQFSPIACPGDQQSHPVPSIRPQHFLSAVRSHRHQLLTRLRGGAARVRSGTHRIHMEHKRDIYNSGVNTMILLCAILKPICDWKINKQERRRFTEHSVLRTTIGSEAACVYDFARLSAVSTQCLCTAIICAHASWH